MRPRFRVVTSLVLSVIALLSTPAMAGEAESPVLQGAYLDFPPLTYTDAEGRPSGEMIELVEDLAERAGYEVRWEELPLGRIHLYLRTGEIDLWPGASGIPFLEEWVLESDFRPMSIRIAAYHMPDRAPVSEIAELAGKKLILLRSYTYLGVLDEVIADESTSVDYAPNHHSGLHMLQHGRGDYLLSFQRPINHLLEKEKLSGVMECPIAEFGVGLLFSRAGAHSLEAVDRFESAWRDRQAELRPDASRPK